MPPPLSPPCPRFHAADPDPSSLPPACRLEELAGVRHAAVKAAMRASDAALEGLTAEQRAAVAAVRPQYEATVARVVAALTDELGAYQKGKASTRVQRWDAEGAALVGPLRS